MDYQNGRIYKIINYENDKIYIGSTTQKLSKRMVEHRGMAKYGCKSKIYEEMRKFGTDKFEIILIENYPCESKEELNAREEYYRKLTKAELNTNRCYTGLNKKKYVKEYVKKYHEANKDEIKEYKKIYHEEHKKEIKEKAKEYREVNKDKRKKYREANKDKLKEKAKEYYKEHKEKYKEGRKEYRETNREKLNEKFECDVCGGKYTAGNMSRHMKTMKHKKAIEEKNIM